MIQHSLSLHVSKYQLHRNVAFRMPLEAYIGMLTMLTVFVHIGAIGIGYL